MKFNDVHHVAEDEFNNLLIVDGLNLAFRYKFSKTKDYCTQYIRTVQSLARSYKAKKVVVLGDGGSFYRDNLYPAYKGNRKELRSKQTQEEEQEFKDFLDEFKKTMQILSKNYLTLRYAGIEADDIAAFIATSYDGLFDKVWLISSDKDWDLLVNETVSRFSYVTRKEITFKNWKEHYDYDIDRHIDVKVLQGDKGDNIKGCEGIGEKRAQTLISQYGSAFDIYDSLPLPGKQKFIQNLNNFGDSILLNYELMDLVTYCTEALGKDKQDIVNKVEEYFH